MRKRIFLSIILVAATIFVACFILLLGAVSSTYLSGYEDKIAKETAHIATGVELCGLTYLNALERQDVLRITWLAADGSVLYDNFANPATMENHSSRPEFQEALLTGSGKRSRQSSTLSESMNYYAPAPGGRHGTAHRDSPENNPGLSARTRPACCRDSDRDDRLSLLLAFRISRTIIKPINGIDFEHPEQSGVYPELSPLISRIAEQNKIIAKQMEELKIEHEARERMRREFTANVSHELKTPLTSISGFAEIMKNGIVKSEDIPRFSGYIFTGGTAADLFGGRYHQAVPARRQRAARQEGPARPVRRLRGRRHNRSGRRPTPRASGSCCRGKHAGIFGAEQIIDEVIHNLVDNAVKYNKENGSVFVSVTRRNTEVELSVSDTGIGIPEKEQARVFERFYRVNKSNSKQMGGTGLGLSIVKHGAAYHNAKIVLDSVP